MNGEGCIKRRNVAAVISAIGVTLLVGLTTVRQVRACFPTLADDVHGVNKMLCIFGQLTQSNMDCSACAASLASSNCRKSWRLRRICFLCRR